MKQYLLIRWEALKTSFWFIPLLLILGGGVLASLLVFLDNTVTLRFGGFLDLFYSSGIEGSRAVLSTIAGSMMTVAGIVFSTTIVALTLASSQFGPRLLRNFMSDRLNQVVLGTYVATFIYCLLVLKTIKTDGGFIPNFSVFFAMILAVINIMLLIIFIHHIATAIQADTVISKVAKELQQDVRRLFPKEFEDRIVSPREGQVDETVLMARYTESIHVKVPSSGYIQAVNTSRLLHVATENDLLLLLQYRPGQYVLEDGLLVQVQALKRPDQEQLDKIARCFTIGEFRLPTNDPEFAVRQLVEIACRALSPGINDPYTAITCIDKLGATVARLTRKVFPPIYHYGEKHQLRIIAKATDFPGLMDVCFNQIRQFGSGSPAVLIRMMEVLSALAELARTEEQGKAILRHAGMVGRAGQGALAESNDQKDLDKRFEEIKTILDKKEFT